MHTVLITGGAGFIGQNLVHAWRAARPSDRLIVIDAITYATDLRSLEPLIADSGIAFVKGDINDAALIRHPLDTHRLPVLRILLRSPTSIARSMTPRPSCRPMCWEPSLS